MDATESFAQTPAGAQKAAVERDRARRTRKRSLPPVLAPWLRAQSINVTRHAAALRPFRREEFGAGAAAPTEGHIQVVNKLIGRLRGGLMKMSKDVADAVGAA